MAGVNMATINSFDYVFYSEVHVNTTSQVFCCEYHLQLNICLSFLSLQVHGS